jgi:hypothetical protein
MAEKELQQKKYDQEQERAYHALNIDKLFNLQT